MGFFLVCWTFLDKNEKINQSPHRGRDKGKLIYHHVAERTRESHPRVHNLQSTTRLAKSWIANHGHEDGISLPLLQRGYIDYFSPTSFIFSQKPDFNVILVVQSTRPWHSYLWQRHAIGLDDMIIILGAKWQRTNVVSAWRERHLWMRQHFLGRSVFGTDPSPVGQNPIRVSKICNSELGPGGFYTPINTVLKRPRSKSNLLRDGKQHGGGVAHASFCSSANRFCTVYIVCKCLFIDLFIYIKHPGYQQNIRYGLKRYLKDTWKIDHVDILYDTELLRQSSRVMKC